MTSAWRTGLVIALLGLVGAAQDVERKRQTPESTRSWREDLDDLVGRMESTHPDLYFGVSRKEFSDAVQALREGIPGMSDDEIIVGFMRLVGSIGRSGRDGHSGFATMGRFGLLPLQVYRFSDGWFVVRAEQADLVGTRLLAIGGRSMARVREAVDPLVTRDNEHNATVRASFTMLIPEVLHVLGVIPARDRATLLVQAPGEEARTVLLMRQSRSAYRRWNPHSPISLPESRTPLSRSRRSEAFWTQKLPEHRVLYLKYNRVVSRRADGGSIADLAREIRSAMSSSGVARTVVDLRHNGGGSADTFGPLVRVLADREVFGRKGSLYVLTDRETFSAAGNFVTEIENRTIAILAGEPTGGAPNQYGDAKTLRLKNRPELWARISSRYHQRAMPGDGRLTHEPTLRIALSSKAYFSAQDPVLDAVLKHRPEPR